jgi:sialic acid synthase SpsE
MGSEIKIGDRIIGSKHLPLIVAEIGINHEGSFDKAIRMVDDAAEAGCECVKFQCHVIEDEMVHAAKKTIPGNSNESIWNIMDRCKLNEEEDRKLKEYVERKGMIYLSTPFSRAAADRVAAMGVSAFKIGSGECNNYPLVEHIAQFGKPIILSTGMNDIRSIEPSVEILRKFKIPFALLHCTSIYPTPYEKVRLGSIIELQNAFPDAVTGFSDHSLGNYTCFAAVSLGASILEKHFTSDKNWEGPDIAISIDPDGLKDLIHGSNAIYQALHGRKKVLSEEKPTIDFAYASVVSIAPIRKGELFSLKNIWVKRPGIGDFLAAEYKGILGKKAKCNIKADQLLTREMVET